MEFPYIKELQNTMKVWEADYWEEKLSNGHSMEALYPLIQINFQKVKEVQSIKDVKNWISQDGKTGDGSSKGIFDALFLKTLTLSN